MSAHAFEHLRQGKEFGVRMLFSLPLAGAGTRLSLSPDSVDASIPVVTGVAPGPGGGTPQGAVNPLHSTAPQTAQRQRWLPGMLTNCIGGALSWARPRPITRFGASDKAFEDVQQVA